MTHSWKGESHALPVTSVMAGFAQQLDHLQSLSQKLESAVQADISRRPTASAELIVELQAFDKLTQSLEDLGKLASSLADRDCSAMIAPQERSAMMALLNLERTQALLNAAPQLAPAIDGPDDSGEPLLF